MDGEQISTSDPSAPGSHDGSSAGDRGQPYTGFRAYQFNTRQLARLLQLRGELLEARLGHGRWSADLAASC
jgi:hypothetical protein